MSDGGVFYNRMKPWSVDLLPVLVEDLRLVIGYPVIAEDKLFEGDPLRFIISPLSNEHESLGSNRKFSAQYSKLRNFVPQVKPGDIVLVPRPKLGVIYAAVISGAFTLKHNPRRVEWFKQRVVDRREKRQIDYVAELVQGWDVEEPVKLPWVKVPGWIRKSLFGMGSYNLIRAKDPHNPHGSIKKLLSGGPCAPVSWTTEIDEVRTRLMDMLVPTVFEHLMVALLQLEHPNLSWHHVGGSGDGGVDALGFDAVGNVRCLVQCKMGSDAAALPFIDSVVPWKILATVYGSARPIDGVEVIDLDSIAALVLKHAPRLSQAISLRVGLAP